MVPNWSTIILLGEMLERRWRLVLFIRNGTYFPVISKTVIVTVSVDVCRLINMHCVDHLLILSCCSKSPPSQSSVLKKTNQILIILYRFEHAYVYDCI